MTERLEGAARGVEHFRGVATVVTKLLCMALPDVAYFGQKDAQQLVLIRRVVRDLNLPVRIEALPDRARARRPGDVQPQRPAERRRARPRAGAAGGAREPHGTLAAAGERSAQALLDAAREALRASGVEPEYVALVDPDTFEPVDALAGEALLALAARIGGVRLIDNAMLSAGRSAPATNGKGEAMATCSA